MGIAGVFFVLLFRLAKPYLCCVQKDKTMPSKDFELNLDQELNLWGARVFKRIQQKFMDMKINRTPDKKNGYTGDLYRRLGWEVYNAAGGNKAMIKFFYMKYGDFVQWGVGSKFGDPRRVAPNYEGQKKWPIQATGGNNIPPLQEPGGHNYYAKLFLRREVRYHTKWLIKRLAEEYGYFGNFYLVRSIAEGFGDKTAMNKWIEENKYDLGRGFLSFTDVKW